MKTNGKLQRITKETEILIDTIQEFYKMPTRSKTLEFVLKTYAQQLNLLHKNKKNED